VLRRLRRPALLLLPVLLLATLTACGDGQATSSSTYEGLDAATVSGDFGKAPTVEWKGEMTASDVIAKTLVTGDGPTLKDGDKVLANVWIGNGYTQQMAYSTYDSQAQVLTFDKKSLSEPFLKSLQDQTVGSRVAVTASATAMFGEAGNPQLQIGNKDTVLVIVDLMSTVLPGPEGDEQAAPSWVPNIIVKKEVPKAFGFAGTPPPTKDLRMATLIEGKGAPVEKGQLIVVNYIGQVYGGKLPFDGSYASGTPLTQKIGVGSLVKGWDEKLVGVPIGSRVVLAIPPKWGYGDKGNKGAGIKGTDTLYFVVDVLAAG
jgi:peptidylprolyl isomerase